MEFEGQSGGVSVPPGESSGGPELQKEFPSLWVPVRLPRRLAGAGGRKKIFRLSDVLKPLTDAQVEAMKLGAVKRILRAEKAVACSGAAQVCPCAPSPLFPSLSPELTSRQRDRPLPGSSSQLGHSPATGPQASRFSWPCSPRRWRQGRQATQAVLGGDGWALACPRPAGAGCGRAVPATGLRAPVLSLAGPHSSHSFSFVKSDSPGLSPDSVTCWHCNLSQVTFSHCFKFFLLTT